MHRIRRVAAVAVAVLVVAAGGVHAVAASGDTAPAGDVLTAGASLTSANGQVQLVMQGDGNLVLRTATAALWATGTSGSGNRVAVQTDGNVVVYAPNGRALWATATRGSGVQLVVQDDANLVLYGPGGALWQSGTARGAGTTTAPSGTVLTSGTGLVSADGRFRLVVQGDGNVVLYAPEGPLWATATTGAGNRLVVQTDGNVVVYAGGGQALWSSGTSGRGAAQLVAQSDGNLVLYAAAGAVWTSGTSRTATAPLGYVGSAGQVVAVAVGSATSTTATVTGWTRTPSGWVTSIAAVGGFVGAAGIGTPSEGSSRTPAGTWTLTQSFGRIANPGTRLPWFTTDTLDWWDENPASPTYNLHVRQAASPGGASENLYTSGAVYDAAVVMDVNTARVPGGGSAFFLHVSNGRPTAGCVAVPLGSVLALLRWLDPAAAPVIRVAVG